MGALSDGFRALGPARLIAMAAVAVAVAGFLAVLIARGGSANMALLYTDLDLREAAQMAETLDAQHIAHTVAPGGGTIMVPESEVGRARLLLARQGLPSGGSAGYELFDRADGLTATQFQQQVTQVRALEGELSRTIRTIAGVRAARVHLVLPKREPFERDRQAAQASVMLTMAGPGRLDHEGVSAILNLVAAAVPGLRPQNVAIVDSRGDVLARAGDGTGDSGAAASTEETRHALEQRLSRGVEDMLERTLGSGRVRAEAAVEMDVAQMHETQEKFDPEGKVERSTQSVTDSSKSTEAAPSVSVQNNLPNATPDTAAGTGSQQQRQEETTNFEIGKTVRTMVRDQPEIRRISLAVLVDGTETAPADGTAPVYKPRAQEELDRIAALVRGAIGYDEKRGDKVEVVNMRFAAAEEPPAPATRRILGLEVGGGDVARLAQTGLVGILALVGLLFVLRPMVSRLAGPGGAAALALAGPDGGALALAGSGMSAMAGAGGGGMLALTHEGGEGGAAMLAGPRGGQAGGQMMVAGGSQAGFAGGAMDSPDDDTMIDVSNVEGQMRASSIRRVAELVEKHPEESLAIMRGWMQQDSA